MNFEMIVVFLAAVAKYHVWLALGFALGLCISGSLFDTHPLFGRLAISVLVDLYLFKVSPLLGLVFASIVWFILKMLYDLAFRLVISWFVIFLLVARLTRFGRWFVWISAMAYCYFGYGPWYAVGVLPSVLLFLMSLDPWGFQKQYVWFPKPLRLAEAWSNLDWVGPLTRGGPPSVAPIVTAAVVGVSRILQGATEVQRRRFLPKWSQESQFESRQAVLVKKVARAHPCTPDRAAPSRSEMKKEKTERRAPSAPVKKQQRPHRETFADREDRQLGLMRSQEAARWAAERMEIIRRNGEARRKADLAFRWLRPCPSPLPVSPVAAPVIPSSPAPAPALIEREQPLDYAFVAPGKSTSDEPSVLSPCTQEDPSMSYLVALFDATFPSVLDWHVPNHPVHPSFAFPPRVSCTGEEMEGVDFTPCVEEIVIDEIGSQAVNATVGATVAVAEQIPAVVMNVPAMEPPVVEPKDDTWMEERGEEDLPAADEPAPQVGVDDFPEVEDKSALVEMLEDFSGAMATESSDGTEASGPSSTPAAQAPVPSAVVPENNDTVTGNPTDVDPDLFSDLSDLSGLEDILEEHKDWPPSSSGDMSLPASSSSVAPGPPVPPSFEFSFALAPGLAPAHPFAPPPAPESEPPGSPASSVLASSTLPEHDSDMEEEAPSPQGRTFVTNVQSSTAAASPMPVIPGLSVLGAPLSSAPTPESSSMGDAKGKKRVSPFSFVSEKKKTTIAGPSQMPSFAKQKEAKYKSLVDDGINPQRAQQIVDEEFA
ncbi:hypothetical protein DL764_001487 [Monosporascus ibericus]|uniref:Uncharacterized protein n=1 Tax=Monosporascus ibericus TaxID=155417 RepID=A0A4Q4TU51_9PEZI|nr:hypothetical protein DL764_001487 [Monosporascus ibericus]